jgi:uncharacterized protein with PIN domain
MSHEYVIGKQRKVLKECCPECGEHLQIRSQKVKQLIDGEEYLFDEDFTICPECGYEKKDGKKNGWRR